MRKNIIHIGLILLLAPCYTACSSFLDELPDNRTELDTEQSIANILVSAYPQSTNCEIGELYSDNTDENSRAYGYWQKVEEDLYNWKDTYEEGQDTPQALWDACYAAIASSNHALQGIKNLGNPTSLNPQKGEALVCRAYAHFMLATTFCQAYNSNTAEQELGIPYMETLQTTVAPHYERGTLASVYRKIAADLEEGIPLINDDAYSIPKYHFNKKAAYAFAARFYLYYMQPDFSNCKKVVEYANLVLGANADEVLRDWKYLGTLSPNGDVQPNAYIDASESANLLLLSTSSTLGGVIDAGYGLCMRYSHNAVTGLEDCYSTGLWGAYTRFRQQPFEPSRSPKISFRRITLMAKIAVSGGGFYPYAMVPAFTTDETLITRAEAYTYLKQYDKAAADITSWQKSFTTHTQTITPEMVDQFYGSMKYYNLNEGVITPKKTLSPDFTLEPGRQTNFIHCILHLRRITTLGEGLRWQDIRRYGITVQRRYFENEELMDITDTMDKNDLRRVVQIPANVIAAGIEANPR